jgi:TolA-binding protein
VLVALAACFLTAAAAGAVRHYRRPVDAPRPAPTPVATSLATIGPREPLEEPAAKPPLVPQPPIPAVTAAKLSPAPPLANPLTASELFANAARARREGNLDEALRLYTSLQHRYPGAPESRAADISLAMIQLGRGADAASLEHFQRYLRHSPNGELVPEALWGEAEALRKLGRSEQARRVLSDLLQRFPDSTYAAAARARLEASKATP